MIDLYVTTYEKYVIGYRFGKHADQQADTDGAVYSTPKFELLFSDQSAYSSLLCVAATSKILVCAGTDDTIYSFEMEKGHGRDSGSYTHHTGSVKCLDLYKNSFLISGGQDGRLCIWDCCDSRGLTMLKQNSIIHSFLSISIHPKNGKIVLTVDSGGYVRAWDLHQFCLIYCLRLKSKPHIIKWYSPKINATDKSDRFLVAGKHFIDTRKLEDGSSVASFKVKDRGELTCVEFVDENTLIAGNTMGDLIFLCLKTQKRIDFSEAHQGRIKGLVVTGEIVKGATGADRTRWALFSASSDGFLKAWKLNLKRLNLKLISLIDVKCRITDLACVKLKTPEIKN